MTAPELVWVGHATVALDLDGTRLITDPLLRGRLMHLRRVGPPPDPRPLRGADAVLISHLHHDHLDLPSLRLLGHRGPILAPRGAGGLLRRAGFRDVVELRAGERVTVGAVDVLAVRAEHAADRRPGRASAEPIGFVLTGAGRRVYFAGDTALFDDMAQIAVPPLDLALLPIWGWGPSLGPGHMDPHQAAQAAALLRPAVVVPVHWGTFLPQGLRTLRPGLLADPPQAFAREMALLAPGVEVRLLKPGGALALGPLPAARPAVR
jgi:L-ascorbate metabolism protein UlaG (beta-lactamase superfamily)